MTKENRNLLLKLLENRTIVSSWGLSDIIVADAFVRFKVNGFKFKDQIEIRYDDVHKKYKITFGNANSYTCSLEDLVDFLDKKIEKTNTYIEDLKLWIKNLYY